MAPTCIATSCAGMLRRRSPSALPRSPIIVSSSPHTVHGVLWRITPRDRVTLDAWENVAGKLYRAEILPVRHADRLRPALIYVARPSRAGQPKAGYMELVVAAAQAWHLPADYMSSLQHWLPRRPVGAGSRKLGDIAWT